MVQSQHGLCAYCCRAITLENSLNEHIKPKGDGRFSNLSMDYSNIVANCNSPGGEETCSAHKKNKYDDALFVSPLNPDCESVFDYYPNGEVVSDSKEGKYTIELLNLNSFRLKRARAAQLKVCDDYHDSEMVKKYFLKTDENNNYQPFIDIIRYFYVHKCRSVISC